MVQIPVDKYYLGIYHLEHVEALLHGGGARDWGVRSPTANEELQKYVFQIYNSSIRLRKLDLSCRHEAGEGAIV